MEAQSIVRLMTRYGLIELLVKAQYFPKSPTDNRIDDIEILALHGLEEDLLDYWDEIADHVINFLLENLDKVVEYGVYAIDYELIESDWRQT